MPEDNRNSMKQKLAAGELVLCMNLRLARTVDIAMVAKAIDQTRLSEAQDELRVLLRSYRHLRPGQDDNFSIFASETIVSLWERLTAAISGMAVGIVSVFMVVGGIVIMNIMLAVVTERTHEIGIRCARW